MVDVSIAESVGQTPLEEVRLTRPTKRPSSPPSRPKNSDRAFKGNNNNRKTRYVVTFAPMTIEESNKELYVFNMMCRFSFGGITPSQSEMIQGFSKNTV